MLYCFQKWIERKDAARIIVMQIGSANMKTDFLHRKESCIIKERDYVD